MLIKGISTIALLICSNIFMTLAWYGHIAFKSQLQRYGIVAIVLISWGIALFAAVFRYFVQVVYGYKDNIVVLVK